MYIYIHTRAHIHTYMHTHIYTYTNTHTHTHTHIYIHTNQSLLKSTDTFSTFLMKKSRKHCCRSGIHLLSVGDCGAAVAIFAVYLDALNSPANSSALVVLLARASISLVEVKACAMENSLATMSVIEAAATWLLASYSGSMTCPMKREWCRPASCLLKWLEKELLSET